MSETIVKTREGGKPVTYYTTGVPGLVVHRTLGDRGWSVTHKPTGLLVTGHTFPTRADARSVASRLAGLTDWSTLTGTEDIAFMRDLGRKVINVVTPQIFTGPVSSPSWSIADELPDGWELEGDDLDGSLVCPHGHTIEMDGRCYQGCVSPLRTMGLI